MVVFLLRQGSHHPRLVQEITVDFGSVKSAVRDLNLNEMPLQRKRKIRANGDTGGGGVEMQTGTAETHTKK